MTVRDKIRITDPLGTAIGVIIVLVGWIAFLEGPKIHGAPGEIVSEAGLVLIGTVFVTYVYEFVLRRQHDAHLLELVENCLVSNGPKYGLSGIRDQLDFSRVFERLAKGDELLWLDTYCPDQRFLDALRAALDRGAQVRMLAVEPDAEVARYRSLEIRKGYGYGPVRFRGEAEGQIEKLKEVLADVPENLHQNMHLRLYSDLPCAPMYIHLREGRPSTAFSSYFLGEPTFRQPHLEWEGSPEGFIWEFYAYFEAKWKSNAPDQDLWPPIREKPAVDPPATDHDGIGALTPTATIESRSEGHDAS